MGDPFMVLFYEPYPFHGFASRVAREYYWSVPSGLSGWNRIELFMSTVIHRQQC